METISEASTRRRVDVVIVGGGVMGSSVAYHLLKAEAGLEVVVIERDPTFARASSTLSVGNVRIQFGLEANIRISQYAFEFLERFSEEVAVDGEAPDITFRREGNLFLVDEPGEKRARAAIAVQRNLGCQVEWWSPAEIRSRFPLYRTGGFVGGTFGPQDGHFDGYTLLMGLRRKVAALGGMLVTGEVVEIQTHRGRVEGVRLAGGERLAAPLVVNCAGAWAAGLVARAGVALPVLPVQRQVFVAEPAVKPTSRLPLTALPSGLYFRSEGDDRLLIGKSLPDDRTGFGLRWEEKRFNGHLWPELADFVPAFDALRLARGWAGLYAVNTFDGNAILGEWPRLQGLWLANGFSGHGLQQAPAVGRYLAERITGRSPTLDLSLFSPQRLLDERPVPEAALV